MKEKKVKMSIEDLAEIISNSFSRSQNQFDNFRDEVIERFNNHDKRFESIDKRFDHVDNEFKLVRAELSFGIRELKEEIERLDQRIDQVLKQNRGDINVLLEEQEKIKLRLKKLELKNSHG
jgi:archaellum component FlaC